MKREIGKTNETGFQVGARKTVNIRQRDAWDFLFSPDGLKIWLGNGESNELGVGREFFLDDGTAIEVTVFRPYSHVRMKWNKKGWVNTSRLQLRVIDSKEKAVIAFHQELLANGKQRVEMKSHWLKVLEKLTSRLTEAAL